MKLKETRHWTERIRYPSIQTKIMWALFVASLLPALIINGYYYNRIDASITQNLRSYNAELLKQLSDKVDFVAEQVGITENQLIANAITSPYFQDYTEMGGREKLDTLKNTEGMLASLKRAYPFITQIHMVGTDGMIYSTDTYLNQEELLRTPWITELNGSAGADYSEKLILKHMPTYTLQHSNEVLSFIKRIGAFGDRRAIGLIQIDLDAVKFATLFELPQIEHNEIIYLLDKTGRTIYAKTDPTSEALEMPIKEWVKQRAGQASTEVIRYKNDNLIVSIRGLNERDWNMVVVAPVSSYSLDYRQLRNVLFSLASLSLLAAIITSVGLSTSILKPFNTLIRSMRRAGQGQLNVKVPDWKSPDMSTLASTYNVMLDQIDNLFKETVKKEEEKTAAELKALQAQIHPHFLYNTLNSLKWLAISERSQPIANAIVAIVKVLRFSYRTNEMRIPISDEIEFIRDYVTIQRMRYGDQIRIEYEWDERLDAYYTLKFILQPIVENAMIHGLAEKAYNGLIIVRGRLEEADQRIVFEVEDNGVGMPLGEAEKLTGVGMSNVDARIRMHFGESYGISVMPPIALNTRIVITIPILSVGKSV